MLQFIRGSVSDYQLLLEKTSDYDESIFLDTDNNRLYYNGNLLCNKDVSIFSVKTLGSDFMENTSYKFIANEHEVVIDKSAIPEIVDGKVILRDLETQTNNASDGLMTVKDKFLLEAMADVLGFDIQYEYYAHTQHIADRLNNIERFTDVVAYQKEDGWYYDYDAFDFVYNGETIHREADSEKIDDESQVRVYSMKIDRSRDRSNYFDGSSVEDGKAMILPHGGLPAGTTVEQLEEKTVSEVLCDILFENDKPVKVCDTSIILKFGEDSIYGGGYVEVGTRYPAIADFSYEFTPETWQCVSSENTSIGEPQELVELDRVEYYILDWELHGSHIHKDVTEEDVLINLDSSAYKDHFDNYSIVEGDKCEYYVVAYYNAIANAKDTDGNDHYDESGNPVYYGQGVDGSINSNHIKLSNNSSDGTHTVVITEFDIVTGWKICSNSNNVSKESLWNSKDIEPGDGEFAGNDEIVTSPYFANDTSVIYMQWPSATSRDQIFYVYVPADYEVTSVSAANDVAIDDWSIDMVATLVESDYSIPNSNGIEGSYKRYMLEKCSGITTLKINISKVNG